MAKQQSSSGEEILGILAGLARSECTVPLAWLHQGVMIQRDFSVVEVGPDYASFQSPSLVLATLARQEVYLTAPHFPKAVRACQVACDPRRGALTLTGFTYQTSPWIARSGRVRPKQAIYVSLAAGELKLRGPVENISKTGMAVLGSKIRLSEAALQPGAPVEACFALPQLAEPVTSLGEFVYGRPLSGDLVRFGIRFWPSAELAPFLDEYINLRREEILAEARRNFLDRVAQNPVTRLYF